MNGQNRKSFLRTLGLLGAGTLLAGGTSVPVQPGASKLEHTEPRRRSGTKRVLRVAHLTDIHVKPSRIAEYGMAAALHAVNSMTDKPDFIMNGGDAIMNEGALTKGTVKEQWSSFHNIIHKENSLPVYHCIGNHDLYGFILPSADHADSKKWAMDEYQLKKPYYSFEKNGWKFIVLDSVHGRNSVPGYYGKLDSDQMDWLKQELSSTSGDTHVCIVSHIPILAICSMFDGIFTGNMQRSVSTTNMHDDAGELVELFYRYPNVRNCMSGHIHLIDYVNYLGVDYYCNGAVAGDWWKGDLQHFAPSFSVINYFEDGSTSREVVYYKWKA